LNRRDRRPECRRDNGRGERGSGDVAGLDEVFVERLHGQFGGGRGSSDGSGERGPGARVDGGAEGSVEAEVGEDVVKRYKGGFESEF